ncbi:MAG: zinc metallopeptidase [Candidatus Lernaella stagnicola]|nr:zinc metallopeptidase [Candidatus Lernaella stagnicola]
MPLFFDPTFILLIPAVIMAIWAQSKVRKAFKKYSQVRAASGMTGAQAARYLLDRAGLQEVAIEPVAGKLSDHYDPRKKVLRLSEGVHGSPSLAALGIAAHEAGHALQDKDNYWPMSVRHALVPVANLGAWSLWPAIIGGFLFGYRPLIDIGIVLYSFAVLFHLVTLPVEFNASSRALALLEGSGALHPQEIGGARKVLSAAAMTYVAATLASVLTLVRLLVLRGMTDD